MAADDLVVAYEQACENLRSFSAEYYESGRYLVRVLTGGFATLGIGGLDEMSVRPHTIDRAERASGTGLARLRGILASRLLFATASVIFGGVSVAAAAG